MQQETSNISPIANCQSPIANGQCTESTRLPWLDFASGIMILWMIVYHAIGATWAYEVRHLWHITDISLIPRGVHGFIRSDGRLDVINPCLVFPWLHFFMPWFFYKSGQFFKKTSTKDLWKKDSQKLLKTFVIWSAIGYIFYLLIGLLNDSLTLRNTTYSVVRGLFLRGQVPINGPLWFLLTLFGVRIIGNNILPNRVDKYAWLKIAGVVLIGYMISYMSYRFNHRLLPYWVANGAAGLSFFALGYMLKDTEQKWWVISPCMIVYIYGCFIGFPIVSMLQNELVQGDYLTWIPVALCCIVTFNACCRFLYGYVRIRFIEWLGRNAMTIYVLHGLVYVIIGKIFEHFNISISSICFFITILLSYTIVFACFFIVKINNKKKHI